MFINQHQIEVDSDSFYSDSEMDGEMISYDNRLFKQIFLDKSQDMSLANIEHIDHHPNNQSFILEMQEDSAIYEFTRTQIQQRTQDVDELDVSVRRAINETLHEGIDRFSQRLFADTQRKTSELSRLRELLNAFKVNKQLLITADCEETDAIFQQRQNRRDHHRTPLSDHLRSGQPINHQVCDSSINPFFLSFNDTLIILEHQLGHEYNSIVLDLLDSYLRSQQTIIYLVSKQKKGSIQHLSAQFQNGLLKFIIKCGPATVEKLQYAMLKTYFKLSEPFQKVSAFIAYWANQRGLLNDLIVPEFALYCMVIDFFQINDLLPRIFDETYCTWSKDKRLRMQRVLEHKYPTEELLINEKFSHEDYMILQLDGMRRHDKKEKFYRVHFQTFPREKDIAFIFEQYNKHARINKKKKENQTNLGRLVAKFFHNFALGKIQQRKINIAGVNEIPTQQDLGYKVMNPIVPGQCLTPGLIRRYHHREVGLPQAYLSVKKEFERAYHLITQKQFKELNEKRMTFLN